MQRWNCYILQEKRIINYRLRGVLQHNTIQQQCMLHLFVFFPFCSTVCIISFCCRAAVCVSLCFRDTEQLSSRNRNHSSTVMILELAPKREGNGSGAAIYLQNIQQQPATDGGKIIFTETSYSLLIAAIYP